MKRKLITGVKPTGEVHLGNYLGALKNLKDHQEEFETYVFIADYHSLTSVHNKEELSKRIKELMIMYLAIGIDPKKTVLYRQSDIPEVTELSFIFSSLVTVPYLMRAHSYKDAQEKGKEINHATFSYPVLMAADILISGAEVVPVGKDQKQHVEIAREIARKFHTEFEDNTFVEPKELINEETEIVIGTDGQKMSKSYGNVIPLFAEREELQKIVMSIPTDSKAVDEPKNTETNLIYKIHSLIVDGDKKQILKDLYETPGLSYREAKLNLLEDLDAFIAPLREKKKDLEKNFRKVEKIYEKGGKKMKKIAEAKMKEVRSKIGL
jgi:tryptophanyl-tRNA synthetase